VYIVVCLLDEKKALYFSVILITFCLSRVQPYQPGVCPEEVMMKVSLEEVERVAALSKIALSAKEKEQYSHELTKILDYVEKINELNTDNVEPMAHTLSIHNVLRKDEVREGFTVDDVVKLAPKHQDSYIVVPKVL